MIGEVAAFAIDDLVKELRCMAARDMGSDEWKKCVELHEKFSTTYANGANTTTMEARADTTQGTRMTCAVWRQTRLRCCMGGLSRPRPRSRRRKPTFANFYCCFRIRQDAEQKVRRCRAFTAQRSIC